MEVRKDERQENNIFSCGCGNCDAKVCEIKRGNLSVKEFFCEYGLNIFKIFISAILLLIGVIIPLDSVVKVIIYSVAAFICGYELIVKCFKHLIKKEWFDENTLMLIAVITAFCIGECVEGVLVVILYSVGELFEEIATDNSRRKIAGLSKLKSSVVRVMTKDGLVEMSPEQVKIGSFVEVRQGDRVPIDGILISATCEFDLKAITGESKYYSAENGDVVYSGAINVGNPIIIKTTKKHSESTVEKIIAMVEGSMAKKAKSQKFITAFAKVYTPIVVMCAIVIAFFPPFFDGMHFVKWLYKSLSFLVISCPCALVISVPLAFFVGIGSLAKCGVLVKGSSYIESLSKVDTVIFDKTGTLTKGNFKIKSVETYEDYKINEVMAYAKALEQKSSHPIAKAIDEYEIIHTKCETENVEEFAGRGVKGTVDGKVIIVGNEKFMEENKIEFCVLDFLGTVVYVAIDGVLTARIFIADEIKENAKTSMERLRNENVKNLIMLSGDNEKIAKNVGEKLGMDKVYYELLPDQKVEKLNDTIECTNGIVAYVGDGINDSPALARADVGISMGGLGSEIAIDSSDVVIMDDNISKIPTALKFSKKIRRTVLQNIVGSITVKILIMIISVIINLPIWIAMFADVGVMLLAVLNSLKNTRVKK